MTDARVGFLLSQLGAHSSAVFADLVRPLGLSPAGAGALRLLARSPGLSQRELAESLGTVPSRVVVLIDALETEGLVARDRDPSDRRHHRLRVTAKGAEVLTRLRDAAEEQSRTLLAPLPAARRHQLVELLGELVDGLGLDRQVHSGYAAGAADESARARGATRRADPGRSRSR